MATHTSILAWRIPWTEEPGGLHPWVPKRWHDWVTKHTCFTLFLFLYFIKSSLPNPKQQNTYILDSRGHKKTMESSRTRDRTHVPCVGRQTIIHSTTRQVLRHSSSKWNGTGKSSGSSQKDFIRRTFVFRQSRFHIIKVCRTCTSILASVLVGVLTFHWLTSSLSRHTVYWAEESMEVKNT